jgi:predicted transposase/invertase (TIGR01784 family)
MRTAIPGCNKITADPKLREIQRMLQDGARDEAQRLHTIIAEAEQRGIQKARQEGAYQAKLSIARNMLGENFALAFISKITGLDEETLRSL